MATNPLENPSFLQSVSINSSGGNNNGLVVYTQGLLATSTFYATTTTNYNGGAWTTPIAIGGPFMIANQAYLQTAVAPSTGANANKAFAVWQETGTNNIKFAYTSNLTGGAWTLGGNINATNPGANANPQLAVSENGANAIILWNDAASKIQYRVSSDFGVTWVSPAPTLGVLSTNVRANGQPQVSISQDGQNITTVWLSSGGMLSKVSSDFGVNWTSITPCSDINAISPKLAVTADAQKGVVAWMDGPASPTTKVFTNYYQ